MKPEEFILMPVPASQYTAVCALLCGAAILVTAGAPAGARVGEPRGSTAEEAGAVSRDTTKSSVNTDGSAENGASAGTGEIATTGASPSDGEIDAHGHPWNEAMHASTKGKTKDGLWRMKVGVSRPDPLPGFPVEGADTGTSSATSTNSATSAVATVGELGPAATDNAGSDDEDEFAAFRAAADASNAADAAAAASVPARSFSDADLGALCNQAAVKLGDPSPIKEIIAKFVPEGQVAHSRNIPVERREEFAQEVEAKAGIQFAG